MSGLPLRADGLGLSFGRDMVLDLPGIAARPGSLTVLAGPSGSGKSSLLYVLSGLLKPATGRVLWAADDLAALPEARRDRWRRRHAGFVFQNFHLIEEMSPLDNVLLPAWFSATSALGKRRRAKALLETLHVPLERRRTALLSRGEQQRVAIARALLFDPPVIFADEPTASLDAAAADTVIAILRDLAAAQGRTVIAASHDAKLRAAADAVVTLDHAPRKVPA